MGNGGRKEGISEDFPGRVGLPDCLTDTCVVRHRFRLDLESPFFAPSSALCRAKYVGQALAIYPLWSKVGRGVRRKLW